LSSFRCAASIASICFWLRSSNSVSSASTDFLLEPKRPATCRMKW
jgi:hypothetical protein